MIECVYGKKFPDLLQYIEANNWIECYDTETSTKTWRNKKTGEVSTSRPEPDQFKNILTSVPLPTRPFVYTSQSGTWTSATFENGDEDYFDELPVGGAIDSQRSPFMRDIRRRVNAKPGSDFDHLRQSPPGRGGITPGDISAPSSRASLIDRPSPSGPKSGGGFFTSDSRTSPAPSRTLRSVRACDTFS